MRLAILATVATTLACGSIAHGAATVWFEYAGSNASTLVLGTQGPGHVLQLGTSGFGPFDLQIEMWANVTDVGLYSANTTLSADTNSLITTMDMFPPTGGAETPAGGLNTPGPGDIATNFGGATFSGPGYLGDNILLGTFTLRAVRESNLFTNVYARVGNGVWAQLDTQGAPVQFGAGAFEDGGVVGNAESLVISIAYGIPEPATMGLLAMGALLVLRRRR